MISFAFSGMGCASKHLIVWDDKGRSSIRPAMLARPCRGGEYSQKIKGRHDDDDDDLVTANDDDWVNANDDDDDDDDSDSKRRTSDDDVIM